MPHKFIGVITGDLYRSTAGYDRGKSYLSIMDAMKISLNYTKRYRIDEMNFFRGDSFQITVDPPYIIELAAFLRTNLLSLSEEGEDIKYDARLSININKINHYSGFNKSVYEKAFIDSGRALDAMPKNKMIMFSSDIPQVNASIGASTLLLDTLLSHLSKPQAEVLRICIAQGTIDVSHIVEMSDKSRQNVHKLITRAGIENIMEYLRLTRSDINAVLEGDV